MENDEDYEEYLSVFKKDNLNLFNDLPSSYVSIEGIYTDFILNYLMLKGGKGKITQLLLDINGIDSTLKSFMERQRAVERGFCKVLRTNDRFYKLDITRDGIWHYRNISKKYKINVPKFIHRIKKYTLNLKNKIFSLVFVSANNKMSKMIDSGIAKTITFIGSTLAFLWLLYEIIAHFKNKG